MSPQASIFFLLLLNRFTFTYDVMSGRPFLSYLYLPSLLSAYLFDSIVVPSPTPQDLCLPWLFIFLRLLCDVIYCTLCPFYRAPVGTSRTSLLFCCGITSLILAPSLPWTTRSVARAALVYYSISRIKH
ncbi:hypothetical protein BC629DRAFT_930360 [Irpex lacteus]|nr:hypothetical protein BC629DRAFT_930360 [Irpex lacteus]